MDAALEYAPGIRVNCVSPGLVETPLTAGVLGDPKLRAAVERATPMRRVGTANDVANVVVFLCSPAADSVSGSSFSMDGGWTAH